MRNRMSIALLLAATLTALSATRSPLAAGTSSEVIAQSAIPVLSGTTLPVDVSYGDHTIPSVACNLASYTNDDLEGSASIKYFDFATSTTHAVPGTGLDRLSDTDGQRIAFTRIDGSGDHVFIYDLASQTTIPVPGDHNSDPSLGGNLVAFSHGDYLAANSEIEVYDQNTGNVTELTEDALPDTQPSVSPDGRVVVWKKCQVNGTGCNVYAATQTGPGAFTARRVADTDENQSPDTNGQVVAYISDKSGENDIYVARADGSSETRLPIPGDQRDLRVSGNLLVFESQTPTSYDVFLYDLSSARLYQVTDTPAVDETMSDIVAGCDGINRIVYAKPGAGGFGVWAFDFQLNDSVIERLNGLIALVESFNLQHGTETSLLSKLRDALAAVNASDTATACDSLTAFINASRAQSGKKLTKQQADQLINEAAQLRDELGCP